MLRRALIFAALLLAVTSCRWINSTVRDDDVVARVGSVCLFKADLDKYVPKGISPEDSANIARKYINIWASELVFSKAAESNLSKTELDVTAELESYRQSLLKYRYEQMFVNERLDTLVTDEQILAYYDAHQDVFKLLRPILKVRFLDIMGDSPNVDLIIRKMSSSKPEDLQAADTLAFSSALKYYDRSDVWIDAEVLARDFGVDYPTMMSHLAGSLIRIEDDGRGDVRVAYVCDIQRSGVAPLAFCSQNIREIILGKRKQDLVQSLEQDLLNDALDKKLFVIY